MLKRSVPIPVAILITFFISGVMHEYVASLAFKVWCSVAFLGIFLQGPMI